jgi:hypothetical protein
MALCERSTRIYLSRTEAEWRVLITSVISILTRGADIVRMYPSSGAVRPGYVRQGLPMGKASGWAIVGGCFLMVLGLSFLPAAFGEHPDASILGLGIGAFSLGALVGAGGLYMKARAVQATGTTSSTPKSQPKRIRGGCDLCGSETPVIHCRVHDVHVCGNCLADHYDFRSCAYVPSTRRTASAKAARFAAKA